MDFYSSVGSTVFEEDPGQMAPYPRQEALKKAQASRDIAALKFALQQVGRLGSWDGVLCCNLDDMCVLPYC